MNAFTLKWGTKFITSLLKRTPALKHAKKLKETGTWEEYKTFVDKELFEWLQNLLTTTRWLN